MKEQEILENNKLIAEFMGVEIVERNGEPAVFMRKDALHAAYFEHTRYNCYHESWSELMPVVEKIEARGYEVLIGTKGCWIMDGRFCMYKESDTKLSAVYQAVISFIKQVTTP